MSRQKLRTSLLGLLVSAAPLLISGALWLLALTLRVRMVNAEAALERLRKGEQVIVAFWHNRLLLMPIAAAGYRVCTMNSDSRDGEIATRTVARWGIHSVRGSATRGGVKGFLSLVREFRAGYTLAIAPDGPRGPIEKVKPGVIHLARATGADIYPVSYAGDRVKRLHSWDRLILPLPFARVVFVVGEPLSIPRACSEQEINSYAQLLETRLNQAGESARVALSA